MIKRFDSLSCINSKDIICCFDRDMGVPMVGKEISAGLDIK